MPHLHQAEKSQRFWRLTRHRPENENRHAFRPKQKQCFSACYSSNATDLGKTSLTAPNKAIEIGIRDEEDGQNLLSPPPADDHGMSAGKSQHLK